MSGRRMWPMLSLTCIHPPRARAILPQPLLLVTCWIGSGRSAPLPLSACAAGAGACARVCVLVCRDDLEVKERCKMAGDGCTTHRVRARTRASDREVHLPSDYVQFRFLQPVCAFSYLTFRSSCARRAALHVGNCGQAGKQGVRAVGGR
jgi:hypothetical protein